MEKIILKKNENEKSKDTTVFTPAMIARIILILVMFFIFIFIFFAHESSNEIANKYNVQSTVYSNLGRLNNRFRR